MRTLWKGFLRFSMVTIPVRLYTAVDTSAAIHFNQLHRQDHGRVGHTKACKLCHEPVSGDQIVKGYEVAPDEYVVITSDDLQKVRVKSTRIIEIAGFVDASSVHATLYDTPYFAGPDGEVAGRGYGLLAEALASSGKMGVAKIVLRDREDVVLVAPHQGALLLYKVRHPETVRSIQDVPGVASDQVNAEELQLTQRLIDAMATDLESVDLHDTYHAAVKELIAAKVAGREIIANDEPVQPAVDIMAALRQSMAQAGSPTKATKTPPKKKPAKKAKTAPPKKRTKKAASRKKAA